MFPLTLQYALNAFILIEIKWKTFILDLRMNDLKTLAYIYKTHSYKGHVAIRWDIERLELDLDMHFAFLVIDQKPVPFYVEEAFLKGQGMVIKFEDIDSEDAAKALIGYEVAFSKDDILVMDNQSLNDFKTYQVIDLDIGFLGTIEEVMPISGNDLAKISYKGKEVFLPLNEALIDSIDMYKKVIFYKTPAGILDL